MKQIFKCLMAIFLLVIISHCDRVENKGSKESPKSQEANTKSNHVWLHGYMIVDTVQVNSAVDVKYFSLDSIIAKTTIINRCNYVVKLYKPLLPNDELFLNLFSVMYDSADGTAYAKHIALRKGYEYYLGNQSYPLPVIIPDLKSENIVNLNPNDSITFSSNIATKYDFKGLSKKGIRTTVINYGAIFPLIKDDTLAIAKDHDDFDKPIYFVVQSRRGSKEFGRVKLTWK